MPALKGVIFSLRDVLARSGPIEKNLFNETIRLLRFLKDRGITPVFATNPTANVFAFRRLLKARSVPCRSISQRMATWIGSRGQVR
jgi:hypothetical protein